LTPGLDSLNFELTAIFDKDEDIPNGVFVAAGAKRNDPGEITDVRLDCIEDRDFVRAGDDFARSERPDYRHRKAGKGWDESECASAVPGSYVAHLR